MLMKAVKRIGDECLLMKNRKKTTEYKENGAFAFPIVSEGFGCELHFKKGQGEQEQVKA